MTAHHVLLAQTKVGFLTGGRGRNFRKLTDAEKDAQREEAYARATVALTRAQRFCFLMCPLDMKGLVGAATVVGSLQQGSGICEQRADADPLQIALRASSLNSSQQDEDFLRHFRASAAAANGRFPPAALVEIYQEPDAVFSKLRRLHLIIVDLLHPKRASYAEQRVYRHMMNFRRGNAFHTTPFPWKQGRTGGVDMVMGMDLMSLTCRVSSCCLNVLTTATFRWSTAKPVCIIFLGRLQTLLRWDWSTSMLLLALMGHVTCGLLLLVPYSSILSTSRRIVV